MSYYRITAKNKKQDDSGDLQSSITVFKYSDKVRNKLHKGAFTSFNDMLVEVFCRIMSPSTAPVYYYELVKPNDTPMPIRINEGLESLTQYLLKQAEIYGNKHGDNNE